MLLVEIPWAARVWALPFLSALAPSERYAAERGIRHKKITKSAFQNCFVRKGHRNCWQQLSHQNAKLPVGAHPLTEG